MGASKRKRVIHGTIRRADVCPAMQLCVSDKESSLVIVLFLGQTPNLNPFRQLRKR